MGGLGDIDEGEEEDDDNASVITNGSLDGHASQSQSHCTPGAAASPYVAPGQPLGGEWGPQAPHRTFHNITVPFDRNGKVRGGQRHF